MANKIGDVLARKNEQLPQFDYLFRVDLPDINPAGFSVEFPSPGSSRGFQGAADISHRVYGVNAPLTEYETKKNIARSTFMYTASNSDIGSISIRLDEYEDGKSLEYLLAWQDLIGDNTGNNPPAVYKGNIRVIRMSSTLSDVHVHYYTGYFPNAISPMAFSYDNNGVLQYEVTFTGDDVKHMMIPAGDVKDALRSELIGNTGVYKDTNLANGPADKIKSTFQPSIDQVVRVVNEYERFNSELDETMSNWIMPVGLSTGAVRPVTPTNVLPTSGATDIDIDDRVYLEISPFEIDGIESGDYAHSRSQFRVYRVSDGTLVYDSGKISATIGHEVPSGVLEGDIEYEWEGRVEDANYGWSSWSSRTSFSL